MLNYCAICEAIRTSQFIQNMCLKYWMDEKSVGRYDLNKYCRILAKKFHFAGELNSQARQSAAERTGSAIARFDHNTLNEVGWGVSMVNISQDVTLLTQR